MFKLYKEYLLRIYRFGCRFSAKGTPLHMALNLGALLIIINLFSLYIVSTKYFNLNISLPVYFIVYYFALYIINYLIIKPNLAEIKSNEISLVSYDLAGLKRQSKEWYSIFKPLIFSFFTLLILVYIIT